MAELREMGTSQVEHVPTVIKSTRADGALASRTAARRPDVYRCNVQLAPHGKAPASGTGLAVRLPATIGRNFAGMESVEGTINGHPFRGALETAESGARMIRVNHAMLRGAAARAGDMVQLALLGPEGRLVLAPDLRAALKASSEAMALWSVLPDASRRVYARWVEATNSAQTRARRIERTVDQLAEGKRRPCCVDTYEYMLAHIDPDWHKKRRARG